MIFFFINISLHLVIVYLHFIVHNGDTQSIKKKVILYEPRTFFVKPFSLIFVIFNYLNEVKEILFLNYTISLIYASVMTIDLCGHLT